MRFLKECFLAAALLAVLLAAPATAGCGTACYPGEEQIGLYPNLMADLVAQAASGANTFNDQQRGNAAWLTSSAPPLTAAPVDGLPYPAWTFNGSTANNIQANFTDATGAQQWPITGDFSLVIVADLNASTPTTGSTIYALAGTGLTAAHGWVLGIQNRQLCWIPTGGTSCTLLSSALSTGTPHVIVFAWSSADQIVGASVDGGAWTTNSISASIQSSTLTDATLWIGSSASSSYSPWWGNLFRALLFKESLQNSAKAPQLSYLQAIFAAKY
jgi:hypothetical protein